MEKSKLKDLWTNSNDYRNCYQTDDDVTHTLKLLELDDARGLVDVGCGNGAFAIAAAKMYPTCRVWAIDGLESAVAECRLRNSNLLRTNLSVDQAWAHSIPVCDGCADRVLMRSVLHHISEPLSVYRELSRVLKSGGRLLLQAPCNYWEAAFADVLSNLMLLMDDTHRRFYYRPAEIVAGLTDAGFHVSDPECWTYSFPFLNNNQAELVRRYGAEQRLNLRAIEKDKWSIENYWVRVVAIKSGV